MKLGIIGNDNMGQSVQYGFMSTKNEIIIVDYDSEEPLNSLRNIIDTDVIFICVDTYVNGQCDPSQVRTICNNIAHYYNYTGLVIIKSVLPPGEFELQQWDFVRKSLSLAISPSLINNGLRDMVEAPMIIVGTYDLATLAKFKQIYYTSNITKLWFMEVTPTEAILLKLAMDAFTLTKQSALAEFESVFSNFSDRPWADFLTIMGHDPRIGWNNTKHNSANAKQSTATLIRTSLQHQIPLSTIAGAITCCQMYTK